MSIKLKKKGVFGFFCFFLGGGGMSCLNTHTGKQKKRFINKVIHKTIKDVIPILFEYET